MDFTQDTVKRVAALAKIGLSEEEVSRLYKDMAGVVESAAIFSNVDLEGVAPMTHGIQIPASFRQDVVIVPLPRQAALANAPESDEACFIVPKVLD